MTLEAAARTISASAPLLAAKSLICDPIGSDHRSVIARITLDAPPPAPEPVAR